MWGKNMEREGTPLTTPQQPAPVAQTSRAGASVGKTMRFHGEMHSDEELFMDGELEGSLEVSQRLTIGPNGKVKANIKAKELIVRGSIQGNVEVADRVVIMNGATIMGDIKTAGIVIEDGGFFKGGIDILRPEGTPDASPAPPAAALSQSARR